MNGTPNGTPSGTANGPATHTFDVLVIGAGISGINAGYRIQTRLPGATYAILEARSELGGTWSLFKYPGIRSDSDLHTFGFSFNPWPKSNSIATGGSIVEYLHDTARKFAIDRHIRFGCKVERADWSSDAQRWRLEVMQAGRREVYHAKWVIMGTGYYDYDKPLDAEISGLENFKGQTVHPQFWPEDLDFKGKKTIVIGSGATAITIIPAMVDAGVGHVTMLQRSPSYILSLPQAKPDAPLPLFLRYLPNMFARRILRLFHAMQAYFLFFFCRNFPNKARRVILADNKAHLPKGFPVDPHFTPTYAPWDQRVCFCPDGDFFKSLGSGRADVVTATIKRVVEDGIELNNGEKLDADIIITATGLRLSFCGKIALSVDKKPVNLADHFVWRTCMVSDVPNLAMMIGYVNAAWTLGSDASARLITRLMKTMEEKGQTSAWPRISEKDKEFPCSPLGLKSTYMKKALSYTPKAGNRGPWRPRNSYFQDRWAAERADLNDGLQFKSVAT